MVFENRINDAIISSYINHTFVILTYICPFRDKILTTIFILFSTWLYNNTRTSALPDIRILIVHEGECIYIGQSMSACVTTNMLHFWYSQKSESTSSADLYSS